MSFLDLLYPPACHLCQQPLNAGRYLCASCQTNARRIEPPFCQICGEAFDGAIDTEFRCPNCHKLSFEFSFARAALKNSDLNRQLILDFKYLKQRHLAHELARFCAETWLADPRFTSLPAPVLIPVPLHWRRKWQRGFNQAEELARCLSSLIGVPYHNLLRRSRYTTTQTRLTRGQRLKNLKNAFKIRRLPDWAQSVVLIDDVFTTGSTVQACSSILKKHAAHLEKVVVLTVLRG